MSKKVAVVLSGCGVFDGTEIQEAVLALLALSRAEADVQCFAPDIEQHHVIDHISGDVSGETRNVLRESARIARGKVKALSEYAVADFDALFFPGGFGAAKNLSNFASKGADCSVQDEVEAAIRSTAQAGKPIAALCIAPVLLARIVDGAQVTIGSDPDTAAAIEAMGARHSATTHGEVVVDKERKLVTSPCYMLDATVAQIGEGAQNTVSALLELA